MLLACLSQEKKDYCLYKSLTLKGTPIFSIRIVLFHLCAKNAHTPFNSAVQNNLPAD